MVGQQRPEEAALERPSWGEVVQGCAMVEAPRDSWEAVNSAINEYFHQLVILPAITLALTQPPWHSGVIGTWATLPNPYTINIYKKHIYLFFRLRLAD